MKTWAHGEETMCESRNFPVNIIELIEKGDPRATSPKMRAAIQKEIEGLMKRGDIQNCSQGRSPRECKHIGRQTVASN